MKKVPHLLCGLALAALPLLPCSCVSPKEVVYMQDVTDSTVRLPRNYSTIIQKDDQLYIAVSCRQPELTAPFVAAEIGNTSGGSNSNRPKGYLVDTEGCITLPIIGKISAAGKSCTRLGHDIARALSRADYIKDASVNVQIMNFKFSVLGEVNKPGVYQIDGQRVTLLEALSMAGDLNIDGNRDVTVIREVNGKRQIARVDLRSKDLFESPYYYVQQNDVIYVTPSERKINTRSDAAQWYAWGISGVGIIVAIVALAL